MRTIEGSLLAQEKQIENVTHYISPPHHAATEEMTVNSSGMHANNLVSQLLCRQVNVTEDGQLCEWGDDELLEARAEGEEDEGEGEGEESDRRMAAAIVNGNRIPIMRELGSIAKIGSDGRTRDFSNWRYLNDICNQLYCVEGQVEIRSSDVVEVSNVLPPLPPLKRAQDTEWCHVKTDYYGCLAKKYTMNSDKVEPNLKSKYCDIDPTNLTLANNKQQQNRKSLPHKKRISRKLKKNNLHGGLPSVAHAIEDDVQHDVHTVEILQETVTDKVLSGLEHQTMSSNQIVESSVHGERPLFICQLCGEFYGIDQMQFFHHLKQHYEPHNATIIIGNNMGQMQNDNNKMSMDKIAESMVVGTNSQLPEALVELSLEGTAPDKMSLYGIHKLPPYINADKSLFSTNEKDALFSTDKSLLYQSPQKQQLYSNVDKIFSCHHCPKVFRRQKQYEAHAREVHAKMDEISEFSEPEDLMEGIHVVVGPDNEEYVREDLSSDHSSTVLIQSTLGSNDQYILPHLTIDNGHIHHSHGNTKNWFMKHELEVESEKNSTPSMIEEVVGDGETEDDHLQSCPFCEETFSTRKQFTEHEQQCNLQLKEEELQRILEVEVDNDVVDEEIIDDSDLVVGENQETESITDTTEEIAVVKKNSKGMLPCTRCGKEFRHRNSLVYHLLSHDGTRPYECSICEKRFFSVSALKVHTRLHSGVKPYKCADCGRSFRQWGDLKYHHISIHSNEKQHQCEYCGKDFARKYSLIVHRRIHTGEKNYQCDYCDKKFRASSYLQNHRRIHTGEKPHTCETCGKAFRMKGDMKRHLNTHAKEKQKISEKEKDGKMEVDEKASIQTSIKKLKTKNGNSPEKITPIKELKIEKQELDKENSNGEDKSNISNDGIMSSTSNDAQLPEDARLGPNFPLESNAQMYWSSMYIT